MSTGVVDDGDSRLCGVDEETKSHLQVKHYGTVSVKRARTPNLA